MSRKTKYYPTAFEIKEFYKDVQRGTPLKIAGKKIGVCMSSASRLVKEIRDALYNNQFTRKRNADEFTQAIGMIKANGKVPSPTKVVEEVQETVFVMPIPAEEKLKKSWGDLQEAIASYVEEQVYKKTADIHAEYKMLKEQAGKSNLVGFLNERLNR